MQLCTRFHHALRGFGLCGFERRRQIVSKWDETTKDCVRRKVWLRLAGLLGIGARSGTTCPATSLGSRY